MLLLVTATTVAALFSQHSFHRLLAATSLSLALVQTTPCKFVHSSSRGQREANQF
jgi:hypothetical protein